MYYCHNDENCNNKIDYSQIIIGGERIIPFIFELDLVLSILNPPKGQNQRFCYRVTGVGPNISTYVSLSHWVLSLCPEITLDQIQNVEVSIGGIPQTVIIGENVTLITPPHTDPDTGCSGLMFSFPLSKVLGDPDSTGLFCFELTRPFPIGAVHVCVEGGLVSSSALAICGPVCQPEEACRVTASQLVDVCVPITVKPSVAVGPASTFCCGSAKVVSNPCIGRPQGICTFTVSQSICVSVPIKFDAKVTHGDAFVNCGDVTTGDCECEDDQG